MKVPFVANMVDSDQVNAFTLPGGFLFITSCVVSSRGAIENVRGKRGRPR